MFSALMFLKQYLKGSILQNKVELSEGLFVTAVDTYLTVYDNTNMYRNFPI